MMERGGEIKREKISITSSLKCEIDSREKPFDRFEPKFATL
jgi:hypothetical protein